MSRKESSINSAENPKATSSSRRTDRRKAETKLLDLLDDKGIELPMLEALCGDRVRTPQMSREIARRRRSKGFYADIMFALTHQYFPPDQAKVLWNNICHHKKEMTKKLGRSTSISVAALDYLSSIPAVMGEAQIISSKSLSRVAEVALLDGLTGLFVRSSFFCKLEREMVRAARYGDVFCFAFLDLDDFKKLNDTHGHQVGDKVLERVAQIIVDTVRETDTVGRYGGEEIAILLPRTVPREAITLAERIRSRIQADKPAGRFVTVSMGIASFPKHAETAKNLIRKADKAMYHSKKSGKNRVTVFPKQLVPRESREP